MPKDLRTGLASLGGFSYPFRGLRFLFGHPRLLSYVAIPFAINAVLYSLTAWFVGSRFGTWLEQTVPRGDAWYWAILFYVLAALFAGVLFLFVVYTFTLVGNLLLSPFNDLLSEKVEKVHTGAQLEEPFRFGALVADMARSVKAEVGRLALFTAGFLALLALNFLPGVGTAMYGVAATLYTLFFLGWEYFDYSMERWHFPFGTKRRVAFRNAGSFLAFGAAAALLLMIPVLNFLAIPVCVIGATLLFCDLRSAGRIPQPPVAEDTLHAPRPPESSR